VYLSGHAVRHHSASESTGRQGRTKVTVRALREARVGNEETLVCDLELTSPMLMVKAPTVTRSRKSRIRELVTASFLVRTASSI
jgi:hypothetical protein